MISDPLNYKMYLRKMVSWRMWISGKKSTAVNSDKPVFFRALVAPVFIWDSTLSWASRQDEGVSRSKPGCVTYSGMM